MAAQRDDRLGDARQVHAGLQTRLIHDMNPWPVNQRDRCHELAIESEVTSEGCILLQTVDFGPGFIVQWRMEVAVDPGKPGDLVLTNRLVDRGHGGQAASQTACA